MFIAETLIVNLYIHNVWNSFRNQNNEYWTLPHKVVQVQYLLPKQIIVNIFKTRYFVDTDFSNL